MQIRQGDILLVPVGGMEPPAGQEARGEILLALGELTGHAHRLRGLAVYDWVQGTQRYVRVEGNWGTISHEEHDPIPAAVVEPGITYQVIPQQEWDLRSQWRKVAD